MIDLKAIRRAAEEDAKRDNTILLRPSLVITLLDRLEAAEKDAARYRWLKRERKTENYEGELGIEFECGFEHWDNIDAAIDAAMKDEQK